MIEKLTDGMFVFLMWLVFWSWGYLAGLHAAKKEQAKK